MHQVCSNNLVRNFGISLLALNAQSANAIPASDQDVDWAYVAPVSCDITAANAEHRKFESGIRSARFVLEMAKNLQDEWEGPGTLAPHISALVMADSFLLTLTSSSRPPEVAIGSDGEVNMSWRTNDAFVDLSFYDEIGGVLYARIGDEKFSRLPPIKSFGQFPDAVRAVTSRA